MKIKSALNYSHELLKKIVQPGENVIDGTVGNGNDTEFLAQIVGKKGQVWGFDIQKQAIENTKKRLEKANLKNTKLFNVGHEEISKLINKPIGGAIFNLGYLPGGNHNVITHGETTIEAIKSCLSLLTRNGIIILVIYYGHPGGKEEKDLVSNFVKELDQKKYTVLQYQFLNQINQPPILIAIQKR